MEYISLISFLFDVKYVIYFSTEKLGINEVTTGASRRLFRIILLTISSVTIRNKHATNTEAYKLDVNTDKMIIQLTGVTAVGVFWGVQTLLSITHEGQVPNIIIHDEPRFEYRGMSVDVARNFVDKKEVFKLLEVMAMYKLNKLHFHLTDDEGWRLEIPGLQELTEVVMPLVSFCWFSKPLSQSEPQLHPKREFLRTPIRKPGIFTWRG